MRKPEYGPQFVAMYPFVRTTFTNHDVDGLGDFPSWRPGVDYELLPPDGGSSEPVCDGWGRIILTLVVSFKPGHYPERVFYTRRWRSPDGKEFGKSRLHIATAEKFNRLAKGYREGKEEIRLREQDGTQDGTKAKNLAESLP